MGMHMCTHTKQVNKNLKVNYHWTREMVQQLGAPIALTEDPCLILVPMLGGSQPVTPAPGGSYTSNFHGRLHSTHT